MSQRKGRLGWLQLDQRGQTVTETIFSRLTCHSSLFIVWCEFSSILLRKLLYNFIFVSLAIIRFVFCLDCESIKCIIQLESIWRIIRDDASDWAKQRVALMNFYQNNHTQRVADTFARLTDPQIRHNYWRIRRRQAGGRWFVFSLPPHHSISRFIRWHLDNGRLSSDDKVIRHSILHPILTLIPSHPIYYLPVLMNSEWELYKFWW